MTRSPGKIFRFRIPAEIFLLLLCLVILGGCAGRVSKPPEKKPAVGKARTYRTGYTVQVGAFTLVENAARLTDSLRRERIDAYYFVYGKGLYKVRFGNFPSRESAHREASRLRSAGVIEEFYVVSPEEYAAARGDIRGDAYLREEIVRTAESFIGVPYLYGGSSPDEGFDCSGLTMAVYDLNGLRLPRSSREQYGSGDAVPRRDLEKGDLVFFSTRMDGRVSHVGVYIGDDRFIHAPGQGKKITIDTLSSQYFERRYVGARTYI
ncbi:MAG TPA: NlpC/P60 family protein [Syntrophales bacterium]|nr:NlpC/P60 family protein [Syntrophales bacterium]HOX94864.1 NlpC/P60 family protein [Syntrophales bacterium]HPI56413.1 NlpC/P60 family protein [Syntrophales bacterium]HPN24200.1 NlpC/P60 family protein [Syntrophales bacterium]HQM28553.1 NlpC/P60 family protein [Syntrophales bacterium]